VHALIVALAMTLCARSQGAPINSVWVDRLDLSCVSSDWSTPKANRSIDGNPIRIGGKAFRHGIGTHANSRMVVNLFGEAVRFRALVGLDSEMKGSAGSIEFTVSGDGKPLWKSGVMRTGEPAKSVDVDLAGIQVLTLEVTDAGDGIDEDHGDWADAKITVSGRDPVAVCWEADLAADSFALLRRLQRGEPVLEKKDAFDRVRAVERLYGRLGAADTRIRPVLESLRLTGDLPSATAHPTAGPAAPGPSGVPWNRPLDRLALTWADWVEMRKPPAKMRKLPAADVFPGPVPADLPRVAETVTVDLEVPFWHSTGLYAPPGEPVTVEIAEALAGRGLEIQVGCHTDTLWHLEDLQRAPGIAKTYPLAKARTVVANPFGGLIEVVVPAANRSPDGIVPEDFGWGVKPVVRVPTPVKVRIKGAVHAPRYVHGETPVEEWREGFRYLPVPMAELVGKSIVFQVPAALACRVDNPDRVIEFWDEVMKHQADLAGWTTQVAPMYFALDRQIAAGGGHSGYPIMAYEDWAGEILDVAMTRSAGGWGTYHEIGHNHQSSEGWTFQDQVEVTVNLFSLYCNMKMSGWKIAVTDAPPTEDWRRVTSKAFHLGALRRVFSRTGEGDWKQADLADRLAFHVELIDAFGWDAVKKVLLSYHTDPRFPADEAGRGGEFMVRWSKTVGRNLYGFFRGWGIEMPAGIEARVKDLPGWSPEILKEL